jgi:trimethylamine--corrinoid protein Co-methyltransferase
MMINQFMKGIEVSEETIVLDLIDKVGPGGNYLQETHTMENFRSIWYSDLFDREIYDKWQEDGAKRFSDRLREKTLAAMQHQTEPLAPEIIDELDKMQSRWK